MDYIKSINGQYIVHLRICYSTSLNYHDLAELRSKSYKLLLFNWGTIESSRREMNSAVLILLITI